MRSLLSVERPIPAHYGGRQGKFFFENEVYTLPHCGNYVAEIDDFYIYRRTPNLPGSTCFRRLIGKGLAVGPDGG